MLCACLFICTLWAGDGVGAVWAVQWGVLLTVAGWFLFCGSFVFFLSCVCCVFVRVCLCVLCGHLLGGEAGLLALVCGV